MIMRTALRAAIVAVSATCLLAACSNSKPSVPEGGAAVGQAAATAVPEAAKPDADYELQFIQGVTGDQFYITMQCGAEAAAARLGVSLSTQGPQRFDPTLQRPILDSALQADPDAIIIAPTDTTAMRQPLAQAATHTSVVLVDTTVDDPSFAIAQVASDNEAGGEAAFQALKDQNPGGGKVLVMSTDPGISTVDARIAGFEAAVEADPSFEYLGVQYSHDDPTTAARLMSAALQKDPDIVGVFAANILAAEGVATGVRQVGKRGQVKIAAFDAGPNQLRDLEDGTVTALIAQQPYLIGQYAVDAAVAALEGREVAAAVKTGFVILTKDNVDAEGAKWAYQSTC